MALKYLLDTNIISEPLRQAPNPAVIQRFDEARGTIAMGAISWHELLFGLYRLPTSHKRKLIESYLFERVAPITPIIAFDQSAAMWLARERARLTDLGKPPAYADGQIASIAATNELILVTRNTKDFAAFKDISVENWFET